METKEFVIALEKISENRSIESVGSKSYAYQYGFFSAVTSVTLENLKLTKKQKKVLEEQIKYWSVKYV